MVYLCSHIEPESFPILNFDKLKLLLPEEYETEIERVAGTNGDGIPQTQNFELACQQSHVLHNGDEMFNHTNAR